MAEDKKEDKKEPAVNWEQEFKDKQKECEMLHVTIQELKNDDRVLKLKEAIEPVLNILRTFE